MVYEISTNIAHFMEAEVSTAPEAVQEPQIKFLSEDANDYQPEASAPEAPAEAQPDNDPKESAKAEPEVKQPEAPAEAPAPPAAPEAPAQPAAPVQQPGAPQQPEAEADPLEKIGISKDDVLARKFLEAHKAGDTENFLQKFATNWDNVPDLEVVKRSVESKYAGLEPDERDFMVAEELAKYNVQSFDAGDPAIRKAQIQLKMDAKAIRDGFKAEQAQYKAPEPKPDERVAAYERQVQEFQQEQQRLDAQFSADPVIQEFQKNRLVKIGEGEEAFSYEAEADIDIKDSLLNGYVSDFMMKDEKGKVQLDKDGKPRLDVAKWTAVRAAARNWDKFTKALIEHGKTLANRQRDADLRNPDDGKIRNAAPSASGGVKFLGDAP